ncbi:uncharacterized protein LOC100383659 [Zea mays]|uniref:Uncharacterized protein n=1 Tax=Zea mays TaxID=4577 RepID=C0PI60_MAIZE|nr:uncharacterized protein LOC100383659 [Zea mays]ACN34876.1 unknown [Zea mays]|eukprot:NP_001169774.1 uncharacterized protein LOC100383659 [Zea mays]
MASWFPIFHPLCSLRPSFIFPCHGRTPQAPAPRWALCLSARPCFPVLYSRAGFPAGSLSHGRLLPLAIGCRCITPRKRSTTVPSFGFFSLPRLGAWTPGPLCSSVPRTPWRSRLHASPSRVLFLIELALNSTASSSPSFSSSSTRVALPEPRCHLPTVSLLSCCQHSPSFLVGRTSTLYSYRMSRPSAGRRLGKY